MKKLTRILGLVGGAVAILWAMRDRLISIAAPKDPEPPRFRVVPPSTGGDTSSGVDSSPDDLTEINGIGPVFASRLRAAGISSFEALAGTDPGTLAEITGAADSRVAEWLGQATART